MTKGKIIRNAIRLGIRAFLAATVFATGATPAQTYPSKPVRMIVPNAAGGPSDLVGRLLAQKFTESWGRAVIVENRVGASGNIGVDAVVKAAPDGYTLLVTNSAPIVVNQSLYDNVPYDPVKDLAAISLLASAPQLLVVPISFAANSVADLIRIAKAEPGRLTFASLGSGTAPHLSGEMFKAQAGVNLLHIPYRSLPQAHAALIVGEVLVLFDVAALTQVQAGKMKALAVTGKTRTGLAPHLPTMAESGLPDFEMIAWYGLLAPAAISGEIKVQLHAATVRVLGQPDIKTKLSGIGFEVIGNTPDEFSAHIRSESARWANLIKTAGIRAN
ncbi:MAG: tripartite tricarboxylate transporter substrate binding protein [Betaproteobacteria bacterium]|nr:tripartite tricarboxylate transporter substrate binding protein [Betaproteobacteria bacterium]